MSDGQAVGMKLAEQPAESVGAVDGDQVRRVVRGTTNLAVSTLVNMALLLVIAASEWVVERAIERLWADGPAPVALRFVLWVGTGTSAIVVIVIMILDALKTLKTAWESSR